MPVTIWATPALPLPPWVSAGHSTVEPGASVQVVGAASFSQLVKFCVVPEPSVRWATTMSVDGSLASGLSAAIAASSHLVICALEDLGDRVRRQLQVVDPVEVVRQT